MFLRSARVISMIIVPFCLTQTIDLAAAEVRARAHADPVIPASDFFKNIVGQDEAEFREKLQWNEETGFLSFIMNDITKERPFLKEKTKEASIKNSFTLGHWKNEFFGHYKRWIEDWVRLYPRRQAIFHGGTSFQTVKELNDLIEERGDWEGNPKGRFTILLYDPEHPERTDFTALQANQDNRDAVFQVDSTLYGPLENNIVNPREYLGKMLSSSPTQGEQALISTAGATIYLKYFMPTEIYVRRMLRMNDSSPNLVDNENYYYLLSAFGQKAPREGQKLNVNAVRSHTFSNEDMLNVGIFTHANVDVTFANTKNKNKLQPIPLENAQRITQIFTAAHEIQSSYWPWKSQNEIDFAKIILQGMYEGTLKKAYLLVRESLREAYNPRRKVFLTLLGGKNNVEWIAEIFEKKSIQDFITHAGLDVYLIYRPVTNPAVLRRLYVAAYKINNPNADRPAEENQEVNRLMAQAMPLMESWWTRLKNWFWPAVGVGALSSAIIYSRYKANAAKENR